MSIKTYNIIICKKKQFMLNKTKNAEGLPLGILQLKDLNEKNSSVAY